MAKKRITDTLDKQLPSSAALVAPEHEDTRQDLTAVAAWFKALPEFFARASEIEASAKAFQAATLTRAVPTSQEEDAALVADVRTARERKREAEDYWGISALLSRLHRRVTAARARAVDPLDQGIAKLTALHTTFEREERERVEREAAARRRDEEAKAAAERAKELADLEAAAVAAEESSPDLSERERMFVQYVSETSDDDGATIRAARTAGYANPEHMGPSLSRRPKIVAAIQARRDAIAARLQAQAIAATPVQAAYVAPPPVQSVKGTRTTHGAECFDPKAFIRACLNGEVPEIVALTVLKVDGAQMNAQGRMYQAGVNVWPGVRHVETKVVV